ncbi:Ras-related protein Rab-22A [Histomonas meleagridis]|uniref:Ras-related protein Rab-22A n=1 Tax=Histomonas meleagridis TaxID=135588 RepID=UPI00355A0CC7|nr:Ras-related protein Rab-22A [Histomonas meleagridis]KAH0805970.1 Ras-related protein Rab-22A [Histomonas meleagridis]
MCDNIKVILLGSTSVGKTTLITRWCDGFFEPNRLPTLGAGTRYHTVEIDKESYTLQVWDTAGQDSFRDAIPLYCKRSKAAMVVFDLTSKASFDDIPEWIKLFKSLEPDAPIILVGNKSDSERVIELEEAISFAEENGCSYFETSALNNIGVSDAFMGLARAAVQPRSQPKIDEVPTVLISRNIKKDESTCCN